MRRDRGLEPGGRHVAQMRAGELEAPDDVRAGQPVLLRLWAWGGGCQSGAGLRHRLVDDVLELHPQVRDAPGAAYTDDLNVIEYELSATFETSGVNIVRIRGHYSNGPYRGPIEHDYELQVAAPLQVPAAPDSP